MFLFDECVDRGILEYLVFFYKRNNLIDELGEKYYEFEYSHFRSYSKGIDDIEVLQYAYSNNLILITEDKDFGELVYRLKYPHCGIVLIRIKDMPRHERLMLATSTIFKYRDELRNNFSVITNEGIKIKKYNK